MSELADYTVPDGYGTTIGKCLTFAEIEGLLAAERERCAALAEQLPDVTSLGPSTRAAAAWIASQIRSLSPSTVEAGE